MFCKIIVVTNGLKHKKGKKACKTALHGKTKERRETEAEYIIGACTKVVQILVGNFEMILTAKLNSVHEFVKIKPWLLLIFWICLHNQLKFHNSIEL